MIRCCGRFCSAQTGTFLYLDCTSNAAHEFSQDTIVYCGHQKNWAISAIQNGGIYLSSHSLAFFNHFNFTSNLVTQDELSVPQGRGAAIYGLSTSAGFNCSYLTLVNNSGNVIVDFGSPNLPRIIYANIISNACSIGFAIVHASTYGIALINCIFIGNTGGSDLYRSAGTGQTNFQLTNCFVSRSPNTDFYTVVANVVTSTTTATYVIGHFNTQICPAAVIFSSETFSFSAMQSPTKDIEATQLLPVSKGLFARTAPPQVSLHFLSVVFQETHKYPATAAFDSSGTFWTTIRPALGDRPSIKRPVDRRPRRVERRRRPDGRFYREQ
jgi:hypothetical protein